MTELIPPGTTRPSTVYAPPPLQPVFDPAGAPQLTCRFCGNGPAVQTTFRQHTGMIIVMKSDTIDGPFCRSCGLYAFRKTMAHTLVAGWWSWISLFIGPITMVVNLVRRAEVANLPPPVINPAGRVPVDPGKPLYQRAAILGLLLPAVCAVALFAIGYTTRPESKVGQCIVNLGSSKNEVEFVDCGRPNEGKITMIVDEVLECPVYTIGVVDYSDSSGPGHDQGWFYCVGRSS